MATTTNGDDRGDNDVINNRKQLRHLTPAGEIITRFMTPTPPYLFPANEEATDVSVFADFLLKRKKMKRNRNGAEQQETTATAIKPPDGCINCFTFLDCHVLLFYLGLVFETFAFKG